MIEHGRLACLSDLRVELLGVLVNMNGVEEEVLVERLVVVPHHPPAYEANMLLFLFNETQKCAKFDAILRNFPDGYFCENFHTNFSVILTFPRKW
jgi:hypothetical protein